MESSNPDGGLTVNSPEDGGAFVRTVIDDVEGIVILLDEQERENMRETPDGREAGCNTKLKEKG